jgi:hypothetical protein
MVETLQREELEAAVEKAGLCSEEQWNDDTNSWEKKQIIRDYSGRSMYGEYCLGMEVDNISDAVKILLEYAEINPDMAKHLADRWTTDSMGHGAIVYFPGVNA